MSRTKSNYRAIVKFSVLIVVAVASAGIAAEFRAVAPGGWGHPLEGGSHVLSHDGRVIAGGIPSPEPGDLQAFRWSPDTGFEWLPLPAPHLHSDWYGCKASAINRDGSRILVVCQVDRHDALLGYPVDDLLPFVYENGSYSPWTRIDDWAWPLDFTPLGDTAVGYDFEYQVWDMQHNTRAVRWDTNGQISQLADIDGGNCDAIGADDWHVATAISDDGRVIVGMSGDPSSYLRPVVWVDGAIGLFEGPECGSERFVNVHELSGNGQYAVGTWWSYNSPPLRAIYWSIASPRLGLFLPCAGSFDEESEAYCISRDGMLIGGTCRSGLWPGHAVLWNRAAGQDQRIVDLLSNLGLANQIAGWKLHSVDRMSADGKRISGTGVSPDDLAYIWWADLTNPPKNNTCANAATLNPNHSPYIVFSGEYQATGTTRDATWDGAASCASTAHENTNIWYKYTAPVDGYLMLDLCNSPLGLLDEYLAVHTGCPGTQINQILCITDCPHRRDCAWPCVQPPELLMNAGQTYYIQVGGWSDEGHEVVLTHRFLPLNDDCTDAFSVGHNPSSTPGSTEGMTSDGVGSCQGVNNTAPGVWYTVIGTGTTMTASTCGEGGDANFDTQISVFCSGCGGLNCVAANDDAPECAGSAQTHSSVSWCSAAGAIYHILVHGYGAETGIFKLAVTDDGLSCPFSINCHPANETCDQAAPVSLGTIMSDNTGANTSQITASCAASTNEVWFRYQTRCDGQLWVDTCQSGVGSLADSVITLYDGCDGFELACNDDYHDAQIDCGRRSAAIATVFQEREILIRVAGYGLQHLHQGTFPLRVSEVAAPLAIISGSVMYDGYLGVPYAYQLVYFGSCGRRFTLASGLPPGLSVGYFTGAISGTPQSAGDFTVHVDVCNNDVLNPDCVAAELVLRIWPTNDQCVNALSVSEGLHYFGNAGATTDGPDEPIMCTSGWGDPQVASDVWYLYTSSCDGRATIDLCASAYDTKLAVYQGPACPMGEGASACNDDACNLQSRLDIPVEVSAEYLVRIGGYNADQGTGQMLLTCINDCNGNLVSDAEEIAGGLQSDCNYNARPDDCDARGDYNADGWFGLRDLPACLNCIVGPNLPTSPCCLWIDFDSDSDVDLRDTATLQRELHVEPSAK